MDSVRSEYSDSSSTLGTSRFGGGGGSSSASFSFVDSSSFHSSRASTTRSDFLSNYEQKFLERKAEKKKKREREKRLADASNNQLTADDKRRADREAERLARKAEMATWLPTRATLQQLEQDRKKRSREKLRTVLRWYPPLEADETEQREAAATGQPLAHLLERRKRHTEIQPLFLPDAQRDAQREQQHRELRTRIEHDASALQRRVADLQQKMACVEQLQARRRGGGGRSPTRRRPLAPLGRGGNTNTQSLATLPTYYEAASPLPQRNGLRGSASSFLFRDTPEQAAYARACEAAELDAFLDSHKRQRRRVHAATKLQATWRMARTRRRFLRWRAWRTQTRRALFDVWKLSYRISKQAQRAVQRKCLRAWREYVAGVVRLRLIELRLYRDAELQPEVPKIVMNLVFMADDDDDAYTRKVLSRPLQPSYFTGFVNAAFASVEQHATTQHRVRLLRAQHVEARRAVAKKIAQRLFLLWKRVHADSKRLGLNAQLCLKRAARQAFQKRPVWAGEKLLTVFELWARWAAFARSKRLHMPMPHFARPLPLWDLWLHNYQERQIRKVKAVARAPLARMKRCFRGFRWFAAYALHKRLTFERATRHFRRTTTRAVLLEWRAAIAEDASNKKLSRAVLHMWLGYVRRKRVMRPWKQQIVAMRLRREQQRAWGAWRNVQLRSCFKRELHRARLVAQPAWRWKVQRLLLMWMDIRSQLHKWKCFVAWRHCVQRRKLFLTVRRHCTTLRRRHLLYGMFSAWKAVVWKQEDEFLEDRLQLSAWDTYRELSPLLPMLFYGCFSDAAAIFAGVPTSVTDPLYVAESSRLPRPETPESSGEDVLARRQHDIRVFHASLLQGSVIEARNLILSHRHLVNGVDELTGNTALHVAASQLEDSVRRLEITTLLLSEGACKGERPNRHGLTAVQLAADDETRRLLQRGIYAFHSDGVLQQAREAGSSVDRYGVAESRLVWCLVAKMSSEYVRGDRVAGDFRREWYSELQDELWLRRGRVCFASTSEFSASIHRCRAFLNGMKRRICRSKDDVLLDLWARARQGTTRTHQAAGGRVGSIRPTLIKSATRRMLSRDLARMEEKIDLLSWLKNTPDDPTSPGAIQKEMEEKEEEAEQARTREKVRVLGEYGPYAEVLLWPVLNDEAAEHDLVHSFVGVLFSLGFSLETVLAAAGRLDDECNKLENDVLQGYQAIMRAELRLRSPDQPHGMPLLRYFTEQSDVEFFFKRELLLLNIELLRRHSLHGTHDAANVDGDGDELNGERDASNKGELQLETDVLLAKAQRKQRKVDKKVVSTEQQVAQLVEAHARVLLAVPIEATPTRLREICEARIRLEETRLRLANLRLKQLDWGAKILEIQAIKLSLADPMEMSNPSVDIGNLGEDEMLERRAFFEAQLKRYTQELKPTGSTRGGSTALTATSMLTELRRLHKVASAALWALFIRNLFRSCCFWLSENLQKLQEPQPTNHNDSDEGLTAEATSEDLQWGDDESVSGASAPVAEARKKTFISNQTADKRVSVVAIPEPVTSVVATTFAAARKASAAAHASAGSGGRRRSSLSNARSTLDTMQRSAAANELAEIQTNVMRENYATSSQLLFESDRDAMLAEETLANQREMERQQQHRAGMQASVVAELNPLSGLAETPSSRLMDTNELAVLAVPTTTDKGNDRLVHQRNRKRELMRQEMARRQLQRLAPRQLEGETASVATQEGPSDVGRTINLASQKKWVPLVDGVVVCEDGSDIGFGNFVIGSKSPIEKPHPSHSVTSSIGPTTHKAVAAALAESLWKRGGTVRRQGDTSTAVTGGSIGSAQSPSSPAAAGFELFASAEDELAFNAAFRAMSASKERRTTPNGRRLSAISAVAGSGLAALSPRGAADVTMPQTVEAKDESWSVFFEYEEGGASCATGGPGNEALNDDGESLDEPPPDTALFEDETEQMSQAGEHVLSDLASLVSIADENEFFDQTLQHYLERVRRDSLVGLREPREAVLGETSSVCNMDSSNAQAIGITQSETFPSDLAPKAVDLATTDGTVTSVDQTRTPHIKWEAKSAHSHAARPLHVESMRLLVPITIGRATTDSPTTQENAVLLETLHELERKEAEERRLHEIQNQPLLLSGKTTAMAARQQRRSLVPSLARKIDPSSIRKLSTVKSIASVHSADEEMTARGVDISSSKATEEVTMSPSVPKIMVAIQRKVSCNEEPGSGNSESAGVDTVTTPESPPSPLRRMSQQQTLSLPQCEIRLEPAVMKAGRGTKAAKLLTTSRRRTTLEVEPDSIRGLERLQRQSSRLPLVPVGLSLEGASVLTSVVPVITTNAGAEAVSTPIEPVFTDEQKRNIWQEFTSMPLTDTMQDAYAQLYPALYDPVTPQPAAPAPPEVVNKRQASSIRLSNASTAGPAPPTRQQQITFDKQFWSAVEGFKAVGSATGLVPLDDKTLRRRRVEAAVGIYQQFLAPGAPTRLVWLPMYDEQLHVIERRLLQAPRGVFDALQQTAQLHIATLQAELRQMGTL